MILYLDSSSIVALYLQEIRRHEVVMDLKEQATSVASSVLAYPEARSAFARARTSQSRQPSLSSPGYRTAVERFEEDWPTYIQVRVDETLVRVAGENAARYGIRGYDSVHLTSALTLQSTDPDDLLFSTWDKALAAAALASGLSLAHEVNA